MGCAGCAKRRARLQQLLQAWGSAQGNETMHSSGIVTDGDDGFALRRVPFYTWAALAVVGALLYHGKLGLAMIVIVSWLVVKISRGRV